MRLSIPLFALKSTPLALHIVVNTRLLIKGRLEGIGRFSHEVLRRLVKEMPEHRFTFLFDRPFDEQFIYRDNVKGEVLWPQARHPLLYQVWFEWAIPRYLRKAKADLYFSPEGYLPLSSSIPRINVIHDINFEHHPEWVDTAHRWHFRKYFPRYAAAADKVITVSEFSKQDIISTYGTSSEKIAVVHNGVSDAFLPIDDFQKGHQRATWTDGQAYFIYVGSIQPRKNLTNLLLAFDLFKQDSGQAHKLLIVGKRAFGNTELDSVHANMKYGKDVIFTGRLSDDEMIPALAAAEALVYVPLFEGFGMPVVEAYQCGVPAIVSNTSALPEVAGESGVLVDPLSPEDIAKAMQSLASDETRRQALAQASLKRAEGFDWNIAAKSIAEIIRSVHG